MDSGALSAIVRNASDMSEEFSLLTADRHFMQASISIMIHLVSCK